MLPKLTEMDFFAGFQRNMLENSININNFNWNPIVLKKKNPAETSKNYHFLAQLAQKCVPMGNAKNRKQFFCRNNKTSSLAFKNCYQNITCFG